jgi:hypothetical protein
VKTIRKAQLGSVVLVALCLTMVLGIAVIGYVAVCARTMQMSNRSFCSINSGQLAEIGLEESLWSLNQALQAFNNNSFYGWPGWTLATVSGVPTATRQLTGFTTNRGIAGVVNLQIANYNPQTYNAADPTTFPVITSDGISQMSDGIPIDRRLQVRVKPAALFSNAVGAYSSCSFTINWDCPLNSYLSTSDPDASSPSDKAIVSAPSVSVNAANVFGYVATTGTAPTYTLGGTVTRADTPGGVSRDPRYIFTNASQNLFDILSDANLPGNYAGDPNAHINGPAIGTAGAAVPSRYVASSLSLSGSQTLTVDGPVIIAISGNFSIADTAKITITANGSLQIVVSGSISIRGHGINNALTKRPKNLAVISRSSGSYASINNYTAQLNTADRFDGIIYVPYGSLQVYGTTAVYGSLVANVVDQGFGNGVVHYDLNLRNAVFSTLNTPYEVAQWLVSN